MQAAIRSVNTRDAIIYEMPFRGGRNVSGTNIDMGPAQSGLQDNANWFNLVDVNRLISWHCYDPDTYNVSGGWRGRATVTGGSTAITWITADVPEADDGMWLVEFDSAATGGSTPGQPIATNIPLDTKLVSVSRTGAAPNIVLSGVMDKAATGTGTRTVHVNIQPVRPTLVQMTANLAKMTAWQADQATAGTPIDVFIGEAGSIWHAKELPAYHADLISLFEERNWRWAHHTINDQGGSFSANRNAALMAVLTGAFSANSA
ncbi:MAG: hypothetical protein IPK75_18880 [Acidobacteria bacterium]|nr:hypothetical protein [Acidobacteriota bacterium]